MTNKEGYESTQLGVPAAEYRVPYTVYKLVNARYAFKINIDCGRDSAGRNIVDRHTIVIGSIAEENHGVRFMGNAPLNLGSIAPKDNGTVDVSGYINWDTPISCLVSLIIFQPPY